MDGEVCVGELTCQQCLLCEGHCEVTQYAVGPRTSTGPDT